MIFLELSHWLKRLYYGKYYCKEKDLFRFKSDLILNEEKRQRLCVMNGVVVFSIFVHLAL